MCIGVFVCEHAVTLGWEVLILSVKRKISGSMSLKDIAFRLSLLRFLSPMMSQTTALIPIRPPY